MQAITACHSLSPRSLTRSTNSSPCGLPAISRCSARSAVSRAYHVPVPADPNATSASYRTETVRLAPVYSPAALRRRTPKLNRSNRLRTIWFGPASRFGPIVLTRFIGGSHLLRMRNLPGLHAALRLAASSHTVAGGDVFRRVLCPGSFAPDRHQSRTSR